MTRGLTILGAALVFINGCASSSPTQPVPSPASPPIPPMTSMRTVNQNAATVILALPRVVVLTWQPNYVQTNEATLIESTTSLTSPAWQTCFTGRTNTTTLPATAPVEFFRASNVPTP